MPIFCDSCGHHNRDSARFCQGCGGKLVPLTSTGTLKPGLMLDKRYEIKGLVKSGGMGAVYEVMDHRFEKKSCALKELLSKLSTPEDQQYLVERFKKEALILHDLKHPNLPGVKDYFIEGGRYYLVMDYIDGKDLDAVLQDYGGGGIPEELVIKWSKQILGVLDYLHNQSPPIVYRDLKPGNVMLQKSDERIMLVDFGIARTVNPDSNTTKTGIGTPAFAPEELFDGKPEPRTDIYSMGATMHCLLTGKVPTTPFAFKPLRSLNPYVSEELESIVMKALEMKSENRHSSAKEMIDLLELLSPSPQMTQIGTSVNLKQTFPVQSCPPTVQTEPSQEVSPPVTLQAAVPPAQPFLTQQPDTIPGPNLIPPLQTPPLLSSAVSYKPSIHDGISPPPPAQFYPPTEALVSPGPTPVMPQPSPPAISSPSGQFQDNQEKTRPVSPVSVKKKRGGVVVVAIIFVFFILCSVAGFAGYKYFNNPERYREIADKAFGEKNFELAEVNYKKLLDFEKDNLTALMCLAGINSEKNPDAAIGYYLEALRVDDKNLKAHAGLLDLFMEKENYVMAKAKLDYLKDKGDMRKDRYLELGNIFIEQKEYEDAMDCFQTLIEAEPENIDYYRSMSRCYMEQDDYGNVITENKKIIALSGKDVEAHMEIAEAYFKSKDYISANKWFQKALDLKPDDETKASLALKMYDCYIKLGDADFSKKNYKNAEESYKKAMHKNPSGKEAKEKLVTCYMNEGKSFFDKENYSDAEDCFNKVIELKADEKTKKSAQDYIAKIDDLTAPVYTYREPYYPTTPTTYYNPYPEPSSSGGSYKTTY